MRPLVFILDDPGVPAGQLDDPFAGLDLETVRALRERLDTPSRWQVFENVSFVCVDRYSALGIPSPDPATMCHGQCEGTGVVPVYLERGDKKAHEPDALHFVEPERDPELIRRWLALETERPTEDGWHFVTCPACEGTRLARTDEGKAIGTGKLTGDVHARDAALRQVPNTQLRTSVRLGGINVARDLAPVEEEARKSLGLLMRMWLRGRLTEEKAMLEMSKRWREAYERVREIGRRASGLDKLPVSKEILREEEEWFRSYIREELRLWHVFMEEIREGRVGGVDEFLAGVSSGRLFQRFEAYLRALRAMYEAARVYALPRDVLIYWMGPKRDDPRICEGCVYMMERSPFPKDKLPAVPRDGSTVCLTNCRHRVVLRVSKTLNEVQRRRDALPARSEMVRDLERIREAKHGTHRQARGREIARELVRPRSVNPFVGQPLPPRRG